MRRFALALPLMLAACGETGGEETAMPEAEAPATESLIPGNFANETLGARIVGPAGPEVTSQMAVGGRVIADIASDVACPASAEGEAVADECVPADQPGGTVDTYVHRITPVGIEGDAGVAPLGFRTTQPAAGFAGGIGYDHAQALAALGDDYSITASAESGALVWLIESSQSWTDGAEVTFYWQSTLPPAGPAEAYAIETIAGNAMGTGPFPAAE